MGLAAIAYNILAGAMGHHTGDALHIYADSGHAVDTGHTHLGSTDHVPPDVTPEIHFLHDASTAAGAGELHVIMPSGNDLFSSLYGDHDLKFGTTGENGGPSNDPDRAFTFNAHANVHADGGDGGTSAPTGGIGPTAPGGGPNNDPDRAPISDDTRARIQHIMMTM